MKRRQGGYVNSILTPKTVNYRKDVIVMQRRVDDALVRHTKILRNTVDCRKRLEYDPLSFTIESMIHEMVRSTSKNVKVLVIL